MHDLHRLLKWKLLKGSHDFPGPDGGTCINEAAVVVAGFPYRSVKSIYDLPDCFCKVISAYAIRLNDIMPDDIRQKLLLPFITRLAGTADSPDIELERLRLIVMKTTSMILPISLRASNLTALAERCESVTDIWEARAAASAARAAARDAHCFAAYAALTAYDAAYAADFAAYVAALVGYHATSVYTITTLILDEALKIGRQANPIEASIIVERAEAAKAKVPC